MKRFTETEKWRDPWFQKLDKEVRTLWLWLCDRVDNAGVVDICWPICNAETAGNFSDETMQLLGDRVEKLETGKWWIPRFVEFQFGKLSEASKVHQSIEKLLLKYSLSNRVAHRVYDTLKEKDKEKDKEKKPKLADEEFIEELRKINGKELVDSELQKMRSWLLTPKGARRSMTRQFVAAWISRADKPLNGAALKTTTTKTDFSDWKK